MAHPDMAAPDVKKYIAVPDAAEMFAADDILKVMNAYNPDPAGTGTTD